MIPLSFYSAHVFFKACPEATNGNNCDSIRFFPALFRSGTLFEGISLGHRNGGQCGIRQEVFGFNLLKNGYPRNVVYSCTGSADASYCSNNSRFRISYQGRDKYDFQMELMNISYSDNGIYIQEVIISYLGLDVKSSIITQKLYVGVFSSMFYGRFNLFSHF